MTPLPSPRTDRIVVRPRERQVRDVAERTARGVQLAQRMPRLIETDGEPRRHRSDIDLTAGVLFGDHRGEVGASGRRGAQTLLSPRLSTVGGRPERSVGADPSSGLRVLEAEVAVWD